MKNYYLRKSLFIILPTLGLLLFQNCSTEEIVETPSELSLSDSTVKSNEKSSVNQLSSETYRSIKLSQSDNVRGWSWDGQTASYLVVKNGQTYLYMRPFDGYNFGTHREIRFSSSDNVRGWYWDGKTASYLVVKNGQTYLYVRPFDGYNFGTHREIWFSSSDNVRSWNWTNGYASYHVRLNGDTVVYSKSFDGTNFGDNLVVSSFSSSDNVRGWSSYFRNGAIGYLDSFVIYTGLAGTGETTLRIRNNW